MYTDTCSSSNTCTTSPPTCHTHIHIHKAHSYIHVHDDTTQHKSHNACDTTCPCIDINTCSMRSTHTHTTNTTSHHSSHHLVFLLSLRLPLSLWFCPIVCSLLVHSWPVSSWFCLIVYLALSPSTPHLDPSFLFLYSVSRYVSLRFSSLLVSPIESCCCCASRLLFFVRASLCASSLLFSSPSSAVPGVLAG